MRTKCLVTELRSYGQIKMKSVQVPALYANKDEECQGSSVVCKHSLRLLRSHHDRSAARKKRARRIRKAFHKQQAKERLLFAFFMSTAIAIRIGQQLG